MTDRLAVFPFFIGCPRSGTTLLSAMFNAHSKISIPFEAHFLIALSRNAWRYGSGDSFNSAGLADDLAGQWSFQRWSISDAEVRTALLAKPRPESYPDAIRRLYQVHARRHGKQFYGDKTPSSVMFVPSLACLFEEARFVHIVRDGRDVALSLREASWGPKEPSQAAIYWAAYVEGGRRGGQVVGPARYVEIRYEDLIIDAEVTLRRLCQFLALEFEPLMLRYYEHATDLVSSYLGVSDQRNLLFPVTAGLRDWRRQMKATEAAAFEAVAGKLLNELGYEIAGSG